MAIHGKKQRLAIGGYDLSTVGNMARQQFNKDIAPCDTFAEEDHTYQAGLKGGGFTWAGVFKGDSAGVQNLVDDIITNVDQNPHIVYGPQGFALGAQVFLTESHQTSFEMGSDTRSVVTVNGSLTADGGVAEATLLVSPYA